MKNYVRGLVRQDSNGSSDSKTSATTNFVVGKIEEYETKANELLARAKEWKLAEEQQLRLSQAISFVEEARVLENEADASSSSKTLEESAAKYNKAVYFLKNYVRGLVR
ncbi:MAG: hypothetical protein JZU63_08275, partial [Rhodoferax sp.]|nr:hypothetical protein [Rhodoferax sp.]